MFSKQKRIDMRRIAVLFVLMFASSAAPAAEPVGRIENARSLVAACRPVEQNIERARRRSQVPLISGVMCLGYMQAMQDLSVLIDDDGRRALGSCPSPQTTLRQLIQAFLKYADSHRDELEENAAVGVIRALRTAFPCPAENTPALETIAPKKTAGVPLH